MVTRILICGKSGTGKSRAIKNLNPESTFVIAGDGKGLPFKGWSSKYKTAYLENGNVDIMNSNFRKTRDPRAVLNLLRAINDKRPDIKTIIVDTLTMLVFGEFIKTIEERGFDKFNSLAKGVWDVLDYTGNMRDDLTIVFNSHVETTFDESGVQVLQAKVPAGKILKDKVSLEELFDIVLYTEVVMGADNRPEFYFTTQNNGKNTCKSPEDMFDSYRIPNDLKEVIDKVQEYNEA